MSSLNPNSSTRPSCQAQKWRRRWQNSRGEAEPRAALVLTRSAGLRLRGERYRTGARAQCASAEPSLPEPNGDTGT